MQPMLAPFLSGGEGHTLQAAYPGVERVNELIGEGRRLLVVPPTFMNVF
jgi:hypothetical protein